MQGKGPKYERETVIRFDETKDLAYVWTASKPTYNRLRRLGYEPVKDDERSASFRLPKKAVSFRRPRQRKEEKDSLASTANL
jgi:hypothetical protein